MNKNKPNQTKTLHLGMSYSNCRKSKTKRKILKEVREKQLTYRGTMALEKTLESIGLRGDPTSPFLKEIDPEYTLEGLMLKLNL